jgi:uroporphyrinogen-III synthase
MPSKKILISQPKPKNHSPYFELEKRYDVEFEFRKFFQIKGVESKELRKQRLNISKYTAVILTSRVAADHFFRVAQEMRYTVPDTMKYFCNNETIAQYLSKYITYRKRRIFFANGTTDDFVNIIAKNTDEIFLLPVADNHKNNLYNKLRRKKLDVTKAVFYKIVSADLKDMTLDHDIVVLFSPSGVKSLIENFPEVTKSNIKIAASGPETAKQATKAGLKVTMKSPTQEFPSIVMAIEKYLKDVKKK